MAPLFSIITVTFNAADTIGPTLRSIAEQSCKLYEVILQDGGSTDDTLELVRGAGIDDVKIESARDGGIYYGMNRALERATGDYVIFLNGGDSFHSPSTLDDIANAVMDNDYPGVVYGQTDLVDADRHYVGHRHLTAPEQLSVASMANGMVVCHQAFVVLRKITSPFDTRYRFSADYDWCIKCLQRSRRNLYLPKVIIDYLNEGTTTRNHSASLRERFRIMCHYYGTLPTVARHFKFALRHLMRR